MESYHVFFSAKEGVPKDRLITQVHDFMRTQLEGNRARSYRVVEMTNKASFGELPDFHLIVDYDSKEDLEAAFAEMKKRYECAPHAPLMRMVSQFRVAFSTDTLNGVDDRHGRK